MHVGEEAAYSEGRFFAPASWQSGFDGWKERQGNILNDLRIMSILLMISNNNSFHLDAEAEIVEAHKEEHGITKGKFGWQTPFAVKN